MKRYIYIIKQAWILLLSLVFVSSALSQIPDRAKLKKYTSEKLSLEKLHELHKLAKMNDQILLQMIIENWESNNWILSTKLINNYTNERLTETRLEYYTSGALEQVSKNSMTYDGNGNVIESKTEVDTNGTGNFINVILMSFTYSNNRTESSTTQLWENNSWVNTIKSIYTYDNGNLITEIMQSWYGNNWVNTTKMTNTYTNGKITVILTEAWIGGAWTNASRVTNTYDTSGNQIKSTNQTWDGTGWTDSATETWTYNGSGQLIENTYEMSILGFIISKTKETYSYDGNGNLEEQISYSWNIGTSSWDNVAQYLFFYNNGVLAQEILKEWNGSNYVNSERITYTYATATSVDNFENRQLTVPTEFSLSNYPNPFNPETTIQFHVPTDGVVKIEIFDIQGKKIRTVLDEFCTQGIHSKVWDGKDKNGMKAVSGIYLYQIKYDDRLYSNKMMLIR